MATALTSWKEIARYVGKGVRTVQRWERELGFPVRRPHGTTHRVLAVPEDVDAWLRAQPICQKNEPESELVSLRRLVAELKEENAELLQQLHAVQWRTWARFNELLPIVPPPLIMPGPSNQALNRSTLLLQRSRELLERFYASRNSRQKANAA